MVDIKDNSGKVIATIDPSKEYFCEKDRLVKPIRVITSAKIDSVSLTLNGTAVSFSNVITK